MKKSISGRLLRSLSGAMLMALLASASAIANAAAITNDDVGALLDAGMTEDVVIQAIQVGEPKFDTSAGALIQLKTKGATPAILKAMLAANTVQPNNPGAANANNLPVKSAAPPSLNPEDVTLLRDGQESAMQFIAPGTRTDIHALGLGGVTTYASLPGDKAQLRLLQGNNVFILSIPKNSQPANNVTLVRLTQQNGSREVATDDFHLFNNTTGIPKDKVVALTADKLDDQSRAADGFTLYKVKPADDLKPGEYALIFANHFHYSVLQPNEYPRATDSNSFYDFGVD